MFVRVDTATARSELHHPDDLQRLHVEVVGDGDQTAIDGALGEFGRLDGDHVWLRIDALREAGPGDDGWTTRFDAMIDYARSKGWTDGAGAVRAHVER
jgi:hypothetical protein